ncbi:MAG TPA: hypothetical protein VF577_03255 [Allosphingosinicella sp.]
MILFVIAAWGLAAAEEPPPPPDVAAAAGAWSQCIQSGIDESDLEQSPRSVARQIETDCRPPAQVMLAAHRRWVESSTLGEREKRDAIRSVERSVSGIARMIEEAVRASRDN